MIETARLRLRPWRETDRDGFAALEGGPVDAAAVERKFAWRRQDQATHGFSYWAVDCRSSGELAGTCGLRLAIHHGDVPVAGMHEIG